MALRVGKLRPSQVVTQWGPGALVDLPTMSMIVLGLDHWNKTTTKKVDEPRLARRLKVDVFREPPFYKVQDGIGGVPARIFPRYLNCPRCNRLAEHKAFEFHEARKEFICKAPGCRGAGRSVAYPARYIVACPNGHLDDFPWHAYTHPPGVLCNEELRLEDSGQTGSITDLWIKCNYHHVSKNLGQAFGRNGRKHLPPCSENRPWLGDRDPETCGQQPRVLLRGASNGYFPVVESAISIPPWSDPLQTALGQFADMMAKIDSIAKLEMWRDLNNAPELEEYTNEELWDALQRRRFGDENKHITLKEEEWRAFHVVSTTVDEKTQFRARNVGVPQDWTRWIDRVVVLERLREVRALLGFTRIDPIADVGDLGEIDVIESKTAPLRRESNSDTWLPAIDLRGEGLLIEFNEEQMRGWEFKPQVLDLHAHNVQIEEAWRDARGVELSADDKSLPPTPARYTLLHSLAHLLMRQLALDCGYSSASLRERIYCSNDPNKPMAGILIYTATSDSDGSLGGLADMGQPDRLGPVLQSALRDAMLCANDPLCADREAGTTGTQLNGAACHACLLVSETSCESANHHLDRGMVVPTVRHAGTHFFTP
jgi:Domain of unknown function (DUF1998)